MTHILVYPTWKCGLKCPYCAYQLNEDGKSMTYRGSGETYKVEEELTESKLIEILKIFPKDSLVEFTGGEPLRFGGFNNAVKTLQKWAITSNTLLYQDDLDLSHCIFWTASFHPHILDAAIETFLFNIQKIRSRGVPVAVTIVAQPQTTTRTLQWIGRFKSMGFGTNIHLYYEDPEFDWTKYPAELKALEKTGSVRYGDRFYKWQGVAGNKICLGGSEYFVIAPDGKMFRCADDMLFGRTPIDKPYDFVHNCNDSCFLCCDWVHALERTFEESNAERLPKNYSIEFKTSLDQEGT